MSDTPVPIVTPDREREESARKWRKRRSRLRRRLRRAGDVALVVLAVFAVIFGLQQSHHGRSGPGPTTTAVPGSIDARFPPMNDVKLTGCGYRPSLFAGGVTMYIRNPTPTTWSYYVDVRWNDGSKKFVERLLHSKPVKAHAHASLGGFAFSKSQKAPKHLTCTIRSVNRAPA
jgi:hypothetical protein